jgi:predicted Zn-dependent peptidase
MSMDGVVKSLSDRGIRVLCETIPTVRSVSIGVWVKTGSRHETEAQAGITHFIEHMLFKGTSKRSAYEIARVVEAGGGHLNAFTSNEYTCYYARCLDSELPTAIDVLADMIMHPKFEASEVKKEKKVIIEEMKMYRDTPDDFIMEAFTAELFRGHALGRPIIGNETTVQSFTPADLRAYMEHQYVPENLIVSVAGNAQADRVVEEVNRAFKGITWKGPLVQNDTVPVVNPPVKVTFSKRIEQTHVIIGKHSLAVQDPDRFVMLMLTNVLSGGMSSRLHQNIREKYGYCYTIHAFNHSYADSGYFGVYTGTDMEHLEEMKKLIYQELDKLRDAPVPDVELKEAKTQLKGKMLISQEGMSNRMMRIAKNEIYYGRQYSLDELVSNIEAVTPEQLHTFCRRFLDQATFSEAILTPEAS